MWRSTLALAFLFSGTTAASARGAGVSIRTTTASVTVQGGATTVSARLFGPDGTESPGLVIESDPARTMIVLAASVKPGARIEVQVPAATDLRVEASNGGPVVVRGVRGQLEILNSNAAIMLEDVGGSVLATTSNGSITATIGFLYPGLPTSFLTSNASIDLTLPADLNANLRMESDTGPITSEFDLARLGNEPLEGTIMRGGRLRSVERGAVNGGGPEIALRTENAPIRLHKKGLVAR